MSAEESEAAIVWADMNEAVNAEHDRAEKAELSCIAWKARAVKAEKALRAIYNKGAFPANVDAYEMWLVAREHFRESE